MQTSLTDSVTSSAHTLSATDLCGRLQTTHAGLTAAEAAERLAEYGPNELQATRRISPWTILWAQFKNVLIVILLVATALSAVLGHGVEAVAITVIVLFAVVLGFVQEYRAEPAIEALRQMAAPMATVLRDGQEIELPARDVVPGDVLILRTGNRIAAVAGCSKRLTYRRKKPRSPANRPQWKSKSPLSVTPN